MADFSLGVIINADDKASDTFKEIQKNVNSFSSNMQNAGANIQKFGFQATAVGTGLTNSITVPLKTVADQSISSFKEIDSAMDTITTKTGATGDALTELQDIAKNIATTIPVSFQNAGDAVGEVNTRFGVTGDDLSNLSTQFIEFANINNTDVSTSVDNASKVLSAFGMQTSDTGSLLDALNTVGQKTGVDVNTLAGELSSNAVAFKEMGLSAYDSANFLGQVDKAGMDSSQALMGLKTAMKVSASNGKTLNDSLKAFSDTMSSNKSDTDKLASAYELFGTRAGGAIYNAVQNGTLDLQGMSGSLTDFSGSVSTTFNDTLDPIDQFTTTMNQVKELGADVGNNLAEIAVPALQSLAGVVSNVVTVWEGLPDGMQQAILIGVGAIAILGPLITGIGNFCIALGGIMTTMPTVIAGIGAFNTALLASPITWVVAGIIAIIAVIMLLWNNCDWFRNMVTTAWQEIQKVAGVVWNAISDVISTVWKTIQDVWTACEPFFTALWDGIKAVAEPVWKAIIIAVCIAWSIIKGVWDVVSPFFVALWNGISAVAKPVWDAISGFVTGAWDTIKGIWDGVTGFFQGIWDGISEPVKGIWDGIKNTFSGAIDWIKGLFNFQWSFPSIPLPHFSIDGSWNPIDWFSQGVPHVNVEWYDKGGVFNSPSIIGVGEKRPEFVGALDDLRDIVREESGAGIGEMTVNVYGTDNQNTEELADAVMDRIQIKFEQAKAGIGG
jgi:phage tail tape measure protein, TP901 family, core region